MSLPSLTIIIPTLNSSTVLPSCLRSIKNQNYPKSKIKIFVVDGGSIDNTKIIAKKYSCRILSNPLKTAEAAKAIGVKHASSDLIALIDSDNILPHTKWLRTMAQPFGDSQIIGSEPIKFTYRRQAGFIERYSALLGANDPYAYFAGVYDKYSYLSSRWTGLDISSQDLKKYQKITLLPKIQIPTIGANGTIFKTDFLKKYLNSDYLFDIDMLYHALHTTQKPIYFAKVNTGIIHTYCESSISKFFRKQSRRVADIFTYQPLRHISWSTSSYSSNNIFFGLYALSFIFPLIDSFRGFLKKPDPAWFFHPLACFITLYVYTLGVIKHLLRLNLPYNRTTWSQ
jgi:glycosyltransferase involved in cell wall biosynthesis